ncbi:FHA domain-containing protein [Tsukamurella asaccharolytica]|nr:FHA domain-containing protein [Tsukamurella asaccharolytica]
MTTQTSTGGRHCTVLPGDRVVAQRRGRVLLVDAPAVGGPAAIAELQAALDAEGDLATVLRGRTGPAFAAVEIGDGTVRALLRGIAGADEDRSVTVAIFHSAAAPAPDHALHAGAEFVERVAPLTPGSVVTVTVGPPPPPAPVCGPAALHLDGGAVPGAGLVLWSEEALAAPAEGEISTDVFPADAPTNEEPTGVSPLFAATEYDVEVGEVSAALAAGPVVEGRPCVFGHLNAPVAAYCTRCGALVDRRLPLESGPRPPLGLLVADDGTAFVVENDMIIGRDPAAFVAQRAGRPQIGGADRLLPVVLPDRTGALSRAHLEIRIDGWQVLAVDVGSANGTWVRPPGAAQPLRLPPGQPVPLGVGSDIHLGGRILQLQDGVAS